MNYSFFNIDVTKNTRRSGVNLFSINQFSQNNQTDNNNQASPPVV